MGRKQKESAEHRIEPNSLGGKFRKIEAQRKNVEATIKTKSRRERI